MQLLYLSLFANALRVCYASAIGEKVDALPLFHDEFRIQHALDHRRLQLDNQKLVPQPDEVCVAYNEALAGIMECTCERFGSTDVQIFCEDLVETCVSDGSSCVRRSIDTVINSLSQSRAVTSCTNTTTAENLVTCVQIFPVAPGDFSSLEKCIATLNDEMCNSCSECNDSRNSTLNTTAATVNCCNVKEDAIQTCGPVGPLGGFVSYYDEIPAGSEGTCPSGGVRQEVWSSLLLASIVSLMYFTLI
jgi:hypothetical protein